MRGWSRGFDGSTTTAFYSTTSYNERLQCRRKRQSENLSCNKFYIKTRFTCYKIQQRFYNIYRLDCTKPACVQFRIEFSTHPWMKCGLRACYIKPLCENIVYKPCAPSDILPFKPTATTPVGVLQFSPFDRLRCVTKSLFWKIPSPGGATNLIIFPCSVASFFH